MICVEAYCVVKTVGTLQRQIYYDGLFYAVMLTIPGFGMWLLIEELGSGALMNQQIPAGRDYDHLRNRQRQRRA